MTAVPTTDPLPLDIPDPDAIRAAIDEADERARLLRRLLRIALRLGTPTSSTNSTGHRREVTSAAR